MTAGSCSIHFSYSFVCFVVQWHIKFFELFNAKYILLEKEWWYILAYSWEDNGVHTFPKGICPNVNVIAQLEFELRYYDSAGRSFNHYTTSTHSFLYKRLVFNTITWPVFAFHLLSKIQNWKCLLKRHIKRNLYPNNVWSLRNFFYQNVKYTGFQD